MHKIDLNEKIERGWDERAQLVESVRLKLRKGWRNDSYILQEYFRACVINWKAYSGNKPEKVVAKLYGLYKQAVFGDCNEIADHDWTSLANKKFEEWKKLKGTSSDEAKRRFLTYLAEFDPLLIDVMPNEVPPEGFPVDSKGNQICAKCNTKVGCHRPLMDQHGTVLRRQLFEMEELHEVENLRMWVQNALANQRCLWGVHKPITRIESKPFTEWFERSENLGYFMYDSSSVMLLIRDLLQLHCEITYDMQSNKTEYLTEEINKQTIKTFELNKYYTELTGQVFVFEVDCQRDVLICNQLRESEGKNHKHPIELEPPVVDYSLHEIAVKLRKQCQELGIDPRTGVERDPLKRCEIYRERIRQYHERQKKAEEAKQRNLNYHHTHLLQKEKIKSLSGDVLKKHLLNACNENNVEKLLSLGARGGDMNIESPRGIRPLLCLIINRATSAQLNQIIQAGALVDPVNRYGLNPLMLACRMKDSRTVHVLMKAGAHELTTSGYHKNSNISGRSALHHCVLHTSEEEIRILTDYCLEGGEDALRVVRFLDQQDHNGDTPLILAARYRNGIACRLLLSLGANPNVRNSQKRIAAYVARSCGHRQLADWLDTKISTGIGKIETFSDINFDKNLRFSNMKIKEHIMNFCKQFLNLIQNKTSSHFILCPSRLQAYLQYHSELGHQEQSLFINRYYHHFISTSTHTTPSATSSAPPVLRRKYSMDVENLLSNLTKLTQVIVSFLREGICYPSVETEEKPLPFTPLMCACIVNDIRSIRLICHEGADPNYCNSHGMTALMLCALLQNTESLCELLLLGADPNQTDNEGYSAIAYATALPLPLPLYRTTSHVILDGLNDVTKRWDTEYVLKLALIHPLEEVKQMVQENIRSSMGVSLDNELKQMKLLEKHGLSHIESMDDFLADYAGITWRVDSTDISSYLESLQREKDQKNDFDGEDDDSDHPFGNGDDDDEQEQASELKSVVGTKSKNSLHEIDQLLQSQKDRTIRCPLCTLPIPCKHFFRPQTVHEFNEKKKGGAGSALKSSYQLQSKNDLLQQTKNSTSDLKSKLSKIKYEKMVGKVLEEAELTDRHTNRNLVFVKKYMKQRKEYQKIEEGEVDSRKEEESTCLVEEGNISPVIEERSTESSDTGNLPPQSEEKPIFPKDKILSEDEEDDCDDENLLPWIQSQQEFENEPYVPLPLPVVPLTSVKPVLKNNSDRPPKKYKPHRRVIKFSIENNSGDISVLDGGIEEGDDTTSISTFMESLEVVTESTSSALLELQQLQESENDVAGDHLPQDSSRSEEFSSTPLTLPSESLAKAVKFGHYTPDEEEVVLSSIRGGRRQDTPVTSKIILKIGPNPINPSRRNLNLFKETLSASKASPLHPSQKKNQQAANTDGDLFSYPGWVFSGLYPIERCYNPFGTLSLSFLQWSRSIHKICISLNSSSFHSLFRMRSLVETSTWKISHSPCDGCVVGIVRRLDEDQSSLTVPYLCMACLFRKLLLHQLTQSAPYQMKMTTCDSTRDNIWPFHLENKESNKEQHKLLQTLTLFEFDQQAALISDVHDSSIDQETSHEPEPLRLPLIPNQKNILLGRTSSKTFSQTFPSQKYVNRSSSKSFSPSSLSPRSSPRLSSPIQQNGASNKFSFKSSAPAYLDDESCGNDSLLSDSQLSSVTMDTLSTISTTFSINPNHPNLTPYGPKELTLIPLLVANKSYDEVERLIRIAIQKSEYHTEDGVLFIIRLLQYQIEIYKLIGLWQLSLYLSLDAVDWTISRLGYDHKESLRILNTLHTCCYYTSGKLSPWSGGSGLPSRPNGLFEEYFQDMVEKLARYSSFNSRKHEVVTAVMDNYRDHQKYLSKLNDIYFESQENSPLIPTRSLWRTLYYISGYGGLCQLFYSTSTAGGFGFKELFLKYCENHSFEIEQKAKFSNEVIQLQYCEIDEVIKHLLSRIYKKYISKKSQYSHPRNSADSSLSPISSLYHQILPKSEKKKMIEFVQMGTILPKEFFHPIVRPCLLSLIPTYRSFLRTTAGEKYRQEVLEADAEFLHCSILLIQNKWRQVLAKLWRQRHTVPGSTE